MSGSAGPTDFERTFAHPSSPGFLPDRHLVRIPVVHPTPTQSTQPNTAGDEVVASFGELGTVTTRLVGD